MSLLRSFLLSALCFPLLCNAGFWSTFLKHDISVITDTDVTPEGRLRRSATPDNPVFYLPVSLGFKELGAPVAGDKLPPEKLMNGHIVKVLAGQGYLPASREHPPSIVLLWTWGTLYPDKFDDPSNPGFGRQTNLYTMRQFLGGGKVGLKTENDLVPEILPPGLQRAGITADSIAEAATDDLYVSIVAAFDYQALLKKKKVLLWKTKISTPGRGLTLADTLPTMIAIAAPNIGKETSKPIWVDATDKYKGHVKLGDPVFERFIDAGKVQAAPNAKGDKAPSKKSEPAGK